MIKENFNITNEEIRKRADAYIVERFPLNHSWEKGNEHRAFIDGCHSRDKEVEELKEHVKRLEDYLDGVKRAVGINIH